VVLGVIRLKGSVQVGTGVRARVAKIGGVTVGAQAARASAAASSPIIAREGRIANNFTVFAGRPW
jgi:hypothetical protein